MAFVVLAVGALMSASGIYFMYVGNMNILVERGWSAFISGSTLLSGGVVTMALGLAIRSIGEVRGALSRPYETAGGRLTREQEPATAASVDAGWEPSLQSATSREGLQPIEVPYPAELAAREPAHAEFATRDDGPASDDPFDRRGPSMPETPVERDPPGGPERHVEPAPGIGAPVYPRSDVAAVPQSDPPEWADQDFAELERQIAGDRGTSSSQASMPAPEVRAGYTPFEPAFASEEPLAVAHETYPPTAAMEPSLDGAATQPRHGEPSPEVRTLGEPADESAINGVTAPLDEPAIHESPVHESPVPEPAVESLPPAVPEAPHPDHATVSAREADADLPATSPVIGRYESEGTSYVMYADGSIDAQSSAGVYRFASMAELKAFIEG